MGLPVKAFPALTVTPAGVARPGDKLTVVAADGAPASTNAWFITSSGAVPAPISGQSVTVPADAPKGQSYLVLTKDEKTPTDDSIAAGPAVVQIADNADGQSYGGAMPPASGGNGGNGGSSPAAPSYGTYGSYGKYDQGSYASYGKYN